MESYNFYNFLQVNFIFGRHRGYKKYFANEYARIAGQTKTSSKIPAITVNVVKVLPKKSSGDITRSSRYKKLFTYKYLVRGLDTNSVEIYFQTHPVDKIYMNAIGVFLQAQVLEPIMYLKFIESGILFMHAGGVADEESGFLLPAHGGTGKTTFSIALMNHGYKMLGDDLLIVDTNKKIVYPYPRPMHLFTYNINNLNGAKVPFKYKAAIYTKNGLRFVLEKTLKTEFLISTRVHADEVFEGELFARPVPYKAICFLRKNGGATKPVKISKANVGKLAEEIMISEDLNDSLYDMLKERPEIDKVKTLEKQNIGKLLLQFSTLTYVNTRKLNLQSLDGFIQDNFK